MSTELTTQPRREMPQVLDPIPVLDTARFEHMQRIANVMVYSSLLPETLTHVGTKDRKEPLPLETVRANAFLVTNQAVRWGMDPFAVAQCVSVVHGRLCYEGKLVAGVLDAKLGVKLHCWFTGAGEAMRVYVSDAPFTEDLVARLTPGAQLLGVRMIDGSVADWKTTGANSPWAPKNYQRQLRYRGTREWARAFEPALLLGVYTQDELAGLQSRDVTPPRPRLTERLAAARAGQSLPAPADGFDARFVAGELAALGHTEREEAQPEHVDAETGEVLDVEPEPEPEATSPAEDPVPVDVAEAAPADEVRPAADPAALAWSLHDALSRSYSLDEFEAALAAWKRERLPENGRVPKAAATLLKAVQGAHEAIHRGREDAPEDGYDAMAERIIGRPREVAP